MIMKNITRKIAEFKTKRFSHKRWQFSESTPFIKTKAGDKFRAIKITIKKQFAMLRFLAVLQVLVVATLSGPTGLVDDKFGMPTIRGGRIAGFFPIKELNEFTELFF